MAGLAGAALPEVAPDRTAEVLGGLASVGAAVPETGGVAGDVLAGVSGGAPAGAAPRRQRRGDPGEGQSFGG